MNPIYWKNKQIEDIQVKLDRMREFNDFCEKEKIYEQDPKLVVFTGEALFEYLKYDCFYDFEHNSSYIKSWGIDRLFLKEDFSLPYSSVYSPGDTLPTLKVTYLVYPENSLHFLEIVKLAQTIFRETYSREDSKVFVITQSSDLIYELQHYCENTKNTRLLLVDLHHENGKLNPTVEIITWEPNED